MAGRGYRGGGQAMTFSLVGRCDQTGAVGAVIASASMAVAARCAAARAGAGAVCSQSTTDPRLREALLDAMAGGVAAGDALATLVTRTGDITYRQLTVVDVAGRSACYSAELWLCGYRTATLGPDARAAAEPIDGPVQRRLAALARTTGMILCAGTFPELDGGLLFNTAPRHRELVSAPELLVADLAVHDELAAADAASGVLWYARPQPSPTPSP